MSGKAERLPKGQHSKYDEFTGVCMQKKPKQTKNIHISGNDTNALVSFMQVCLCKFSILSKKKNEAKIKKFIRKCGQSYLFI